MLKKIRVRRYLPGDEQKICKLIKEDILEEMVKDYPKNSIDYLIKMNNEEFIKNRAKEFHAYVLLDEEKIVGVGMIGPYWGKIDESSFFTIFRDPAYKGKGLGRKIIETLENDEFFKRSKRIEIPSSITAVEFYKHFGYNFKKPLVHIVDFEGIYRLEKFTKKGLQTKGDDDPILNGYNIRPYIENNYYKFKDFIIHCLKLSQKENLNYSEKYFSNVFDENNLWIIQLNGENIGFCRISKSKEDKLCLDFLELVKKYNSEKFKNKIEKDMKNFLQKSRQYQK